MGAVSVRRLGEPRARRSLQPVMLVVLAVVACSGPAEYTLAVSDAGVLAVADPVLADDHRVGNVTRISTDAVGARVRFQILDDAPPIRRGDLLRISKPLLSTRAHIQVTRGCGSDTSVVRPDAVVREASSGQVLGLRALCAADRAWHGMQTLVEASSRAWLEERMQEELSETGWELVLAQWLGGIRAFLEVGYAGGGGEELRRLLWGGEVLLRHFAAERRAVAQADSVRRWLEALRNHGQ